MKYFPLFLLILIFSCCNDKDNKLNMALNMAGENRKELKKVLAHYKANPADSLKYKAACFLIENMQWHYGKKVIPPNDLWNFFMVEDSLVKAIMENPNYWKNDWALSGYKYGAKKILVGNAIKDFEIEHNFHSDLRALDADFLIETIETAFKVKELEWSKDLSFEDFCEYILPYRFNNEPVLPIRGKLNEQFINLYSIDSLRQNPYNAISWLNKYIDSFYWDWGDQKPEVPDLSFYNILYWQHASILCSQHVVILGQIMRSIGLPIVEVFTPKWRDSNFGHSWCVIPGGDGSPALFSAIHQTPGEVYINHIPGLATKLYMNTFAPQSSNPYFQKADNEDLPTSFNTPCIKDVTGQFVPSRDIEVELILEHPNRNLCWFSVFIQGKWEPVGWGKTNRETNSVIFEQVPIGLTGIACFFEKGNTIPCSKLFTVTENGLDYIEQDETTLSLFLSRKFPEKIRLQAFNGDIIGTKLQGANSSNFSDSITLHTISDTLKPYFQDIIFKNENTFRYYRLLSPIWELNIAELEFITDKKEVGTVEASPLPVFGRNNIAPSTPTYKFTGNIVADDPDSTVFDGDMLSFSSKQWVGLDFEQPRKINRIRIAPRNANNGIVVGDNYQLYYWDDGWSQAGVQQAQYNFVEFENVPANTIYWLKNLDHGKEEQPFFYINGKQVFSNQGSL